MITDYVAPIWTRLRGETSKAFRAFQVYRDIGLGRSILKAMDQLGVGRGNKRTWDYWSSDNGWVARCAAYDAWLDQQRLKAAQEAAWDAVAADDAA